MARRKPYPTRGISRMPLHPARLRQASALFSGAPALMDCGGPSARSTTCNSTARWRASCWVASARPRAYCSAYADVVARGLMAGFDHPRSQNAAPSESHALGVTKLD
jgi:hypothetical protein